MVKTLNPQIVPSVYWIAAYVIFTLPVRIILSLEVMVQDWHIKTDNIALALTMAFGGDIQGRHYQNLISLPCRLTNRPDAYILRPAEAPQHPHSPTSPRASIPSPRRLRQEGSTTTNPFQDGAREAATSVEPGQTFSLAPAPKGRKQRPPPAIKIPSGYNLPEPMSAGAAVDQDTTTRSSEPAHGDPPPGYTDSTSLTPSAPQLDELGATNSLPPLSVAQVGDYEQEPPYWASQPGGQGQEDGPRNH